VKEIRKDKNKIREIKVGSQSGTVKRDIVGIGDPIPDLELLGSFILECSDSAQRKIRNIELFSPGRASSQKRIPGIIELLNNGGSLDERPICCERKKEG
jgi:hypothetical protein